jgi:hypothetical protein
MTCEANLANSAEGQPLIPNTRQAILNVFNGINAILFEDEDIEEIDPLPF